MASGLLKRMTKSPSHSSPRLNRGSINKDSIVLVQNQSEIDEIDNTIEHITGCSDCRKHRQETRKICKSDVFVAVHKTGNKNNNTDFLPTGSGVRVKSEVGEPDCCCCDYVSRGCDQVM